MRFHTIYIETGLQFLTHKDLILIQAATMAMLYNPACCCLINGTVCIPPMKENYQPPEHLKDFISVSLKEVWNIMVHSTRCIHKVISVMEMLLGETLKCTPDFILCFWK